MTDFRGNIDHWLKQSEPDYYLFFLKAWIPFNAWYVAELPHLNKKDSKIIPELQDNANSKPRHIIENYLNNTNPESKIFKYHLAELHNKLENKTIKHNGNKLSFKQIFLSKNPKTFERDNDKKGNIYKAEVRNGFLEAIIVDKGTRTLLHFKQPQYNIEELKKYNDFIKIRDKTVQNKILKCYEAIDPNKSISLTSTSRIKTEYILLCPESKVKFINEPEIIAKACIQVLYKLRCMLFHGEIEPTNTNKPVYEHAFYVLRLIIKELQ